MMNVLIPTDFSYTSLNYAAQAARQLGEKCNVFLFHALDVPDNLADTMSRVGIRADQKLITEELRVRCRKIKSNNPGIANIYMRIMHGTTLAAFRNFADANEIDLIFLPEGYQFRAVVRDSVDPTDWFGQSGIKVLIRDTSLQGSDEQHSQKPSAGLN